jgi:hypothetical protein
MSKFNIVVCSIGKPSFWLPKYYLLPKNRFTFAPNVSYKFLELPWIKEENKANIQFTPNDACTHDYFDETNLIYVPFAHDILSISTDVLFEVTERKKKGQDIKLCACVFGNIPYYLLESNNNVDYVTLYEHLYIANKKHVTI